MIVDNADSQIDSAVSFNKPNSGTYRQLAITLNNADNQIDSEL